MSADSCAEGVPNSFCDTDVNKCKCDSDYMPVVSLDQCISTCVGHGDLCGNYYSGSSCNSETGQCECENGFELNEQTEQCEEACDINSGYYKPQGASECEKIRIGSHCTGEPLSFCESVILGSHCSVTCTCDGGRAPSADKSQCYIPDFSYVGQSALINNSPIKPGENVTLVFFAQYLGYRTTFTINFDDSVTGTIQSLDKTSEWTSYFHMLPSLPFSNVDDVYRAVISHQYSSAATFYARVTASNIFEVTTAQTNVIVDDTCYSPEIKIEGAGGSEKEILEKKRNQNIIFTAKVVKFSCEAKGKNVFEWSVYKVFSMEDIPTSGNKVNLFNTDESVLKIPKFKLESGLHKVILRVSLILIMLF